MDNFIAFLNTFASYLLVYVVFIAVIVIAFFIGVKTSKAKDSKAAAQAVTETASDDAKA